MSRRPLNPEVWEQALINGRRVHPGDGAAAVQWAEGWYVEQGGGFLDLQQEAAPEPAPEPQPEPEPEPKAEVKAEVKVEVEAEPVKVAKPPRRRVRHDED